MSKPSKAPGQEPVTIAQLPGESALWYARFRADCEMGSIRTPLNLYNSERIKAGKPKVRNLPGGWSNPTTKFRWRERAKLWDARDQRVADEARAEVIRQDATAKTRLQIRDDRREVQEEEEWQFRTLLLAKAKEMLEGSLYNKRASADGKSILVTPAKWSLFTMVQMVELASKLGRMSARMPVEPEPEAAGDLGATFFETSGQLADVLPPGAVPEMPANTHVKPPIGNLQPQGGKAGIPSQPEIERPDRTI